MRHLRWLLPLFLLALLTLPTLAATSGAPSSPTPQSHPDIPDHPSWVRPTLLFVAILFAAAIPMGFIVRSGLKSGDEPDAAPVSHSAHDSGHH